MIKDDGSDSDFKASPPPKAKKAAKPAKKKLQNFGSVSDDDDGFGAKPAAKKAKKETKPAKPKAPPKAKAPAKKAKKTFDSDMSDQGVMKTLALVLALRKRARAKR